MDDFRSERVGDGDAAPPSRDAGHSGTVSLWLPSLVRTARLLTPHNLVMLRVIAEKRPSSIGELALLTGRAEPNLLRSLRKLEQLGIVRFENGARRAKRPVVTARWVQFRIDLLDCMTP